MMQASKMKEITNQYIIRCRENGANKAADVMNTLESVMVKRASDGEDCAVLYIMRLISSFENDVEEEAYVSYIKSTLLDAGYGVRFNEDLGTLFVNW